MLKDKHILYVEDDPMSRQAVDLVLRRVMGIENVTIFENSYGFVERVRALPTRPDVILLDIHMTPLDGFQMLDLLRGELGFANTPIVALTASVMNEEVSLLQSHGFDGGISKPLQVATFPATLGRIVAGENVWHITNV
jgi:CheY-like chemotaxis protein